MARSPDDNIYLLTQSNVLTQGTFSHSNVLTQGTFLLLPVNTCQVPTVTENVGSLIFNCQMNPYPAPNNAKLSQTTWDKK